MFFFLWSIQHVFVGVSSSKRQRVGVDETSLTRSCSSQLSCQTLLICFALQSHAWDNGMRWKQLNSQILIVEMMDDVFCEHALLPHLQSKWFQENSRSSYPHHQRIHGLSHRLRMPDVSLLPCRLLGRDRNTKSATDRWPWHQESRIVCHSRGIPEPSGRRGHQTTHLLDRSVQAQPLLDLRHHFSRRLFSSSFHCILNLLSSLCLHA